MSIDIEHTASPQEPGCFRGDERLWATYWAATTDTARRDAAGAIISHHMGFIRDYAHKNAFRSWDRDTRDEYFQELCAFALELLPKWDPDRAPFVSFLAVRFPQKRWDVLDYSDPVHVRRWSRRMRSIAETYVAEHLHATGVHPSDIEVAEYLSVMWERPVTAATVRKLLRRVKLATAAETGADGERQEPAVARVIDPAPTPEAAAVATDTREFVRRVLDTMKLTELETAILTDRLMADGAPTRLVDLADRFGVSTGAVSRAEAALSERLRTLLASVR